MLCGVVCFGCGVVMEEMIRGVGELAACRIGDGDDAVFMCSMAGSCGMVRADGSGGVEEGEGAMGSGDSCRMASCGCGCFRVCELNEGGSVTVVTLTLGKLLRNVSRSAGFGAFKSTPRSRSTDGPC